MTRLAQSIMALLVLNSSSQVFGQTDFRQVLASGNWSSQQSVFFTSTLGQPFVGIEYSQAGQLRQGFEQPREFVDPIEGCMNPTACNFNPEASLSDESCEYVSCLIGCTDADACNFDPDVIADDGSCIFSCCPGPGCCNEGTHWDELSQTCIVTFPADINFDGCVQLIDLLDLLSDYGGCVD